MLRQHPAIVLAKPKPAFAVLTTNAIDLCGVLSSLKAEDGTSPRDSKKFSQVAIEVAEKWIIARCLCLTLAKCKPERGWLKAP